MSAITIAKRSVASPQSDCGLGEHGVRTKLGSDFQTGCCDRGVRSTTRRGIEEPDDERMTIPPPAVTSKGVRQRRVPLPDRAPRHVRGKAMQGYERNQTAAARRSRSGASGERFSPVHVARPVIGPRLGNRCGAFSRASTEPVSASWECSSAHLVLALRLPSPRQRVGDDCVRTSPSAASAGRSTRSKEYDAPTPAF